MLHGYQYFLLSPQCFQKASSSGALTLVDVQYWVKIFMIRKHFPNNFHRFLTSKEQLVHLSYHRISNSCQFSYRRLYQFPGMTSFSDVIDRISKKYQRKNSIGYLTSSQTNPGFYVIADF